MQLTMRIGAAIGIIVLAGCSQGTQDNNANFQPNTEMTANETVLPPDDATGETDTLGNQLNQLNDSGVEVTNEAENSAVDQ